MAMSGDSVVAKLIGVVIFTTLLGALVPTVLAAFLNVSASNIVLAGVIGTIAGILFGVFALKGIMGFLK